tara:strand:+ start:964 stop:1578 length:615 start_codon:yes stop_codon:yes gene_type:complete
MHEGLLKHLDEQPDQEAYADLWFDKLAPHSLEACLQAVDDVKLPFHLSEYPGAIADRAAQVQYEKLRPMEPECFRHGSVKCLNCFDSFSGFTTIWSREAQRYFHMNFMNGFPPDARERLKESLKQDRAKKYSTVVCSCDSRGAKAKRDADSGIVERKRLVFDSKSQCLWGHGLGKELVAWLKKNPNWNSNEIVWEQHDYPGRKH